MKEYSITMKSDGSAVLTKNGWNPKCDEEFDTTTSGEKIPKHWLYKEGMKVVTKTAKVITITSIRKSASKNGYSTPKWRIVSNDGEYWASEIAGILVRDNIPPYELEAFIKGL